MPGPVDEPYGTLRPFGGGYMPLSSDMLLILVHQLRAKLPALPFLSWFLGDAAASGTSQTLSTLTESWIYLSILNFITAKIRSIYTYFDPMNKLVNTAYIESLHDSYDESYRWLSQWWSTHPSFGRSRNFLTTTSMEVDGSQNREYIYVYNDDRHSRKKAPDETEPTIKFWPRFQGKQALWFVHKKTLFRLTRKDENASGSMWRGDSIMVRCFSRSREPLISFLKDARARYQEKQEQQTTLQIMTFDEFRGSWIVSDERRGRPLESLILEDKMKEKMLRDAKEFFHPKNREWYHNRGIGYRRGWLLTGPPGTGKTSTIQALATDLRLPCYILNLAGNTLSDYILNNALREIPPRALVTFEDIDIWASKVQKRRLSDDGPAWAKKSKKESLHGPVRAKSNKDDHKAGDWKASANGADSASDGEKEADETDKEEDGPFRPNGPWGDPYRPSRKEKESERGESGVSLSALLNAIDGLEATDGRLTVLTTNDPSMLDPALVRPGRVDVTFTYTRATRDQARRLFVEFYKGWRARDSEESFFSLPDTSDSENAGKGSDNEEEEEVVKGEQEAGAKEVERLSHVWQGFVEDEEFSLASLQGALLVHKRNPRAAIAAMPEWLGENRKSAGLKRFEKAAEERRQEHLSKSIAMSDDKPAFKRHPSL